MGLMSGPSSLHHRVALATFSTSTSPSSSAQPSQTTHPAASTPSSSKDHQCSKKIDHFIPAAFEGIYITNADLHDPLSTTPSSKVVLESVRKHLRYQIELQFSPLGDHNLVMACPHPGAVSYLHDMTRMVACDIHSDMVTLDYLTILNAANEIGELRKKATALERPAGDNARLKDAATGTRSIRLSPSFNPATYSPHVARDDYDDEYNDDFDDDDNDEVDSRDRNTPDNTRVPINLSVVMPAYDGSEMDVVKTSGRANHGDISGSKLENRGRRSKAGTGRDFWGSTAGGVSPRYHYELGFSNHDLELVINSLRSCILSRREASGDDGNRLIIYYKDITESLEGGKEHGKRVLTSILNLVDNLRNSHNIPALLVGGCTPSLIKNRLTSGTNNQEFFRQIFSGPVTSHQSPHNPPIQLLSNSVLFNTCVDNMTADFRKIEVPPPVPRLQISSGVVAADKSVAPDSTQALVQYNSWLEDMYLAQTQRFREINWRNIELALRKQGIEIRGLSISDVLSPESADRNNVSAKCQDLFETLDNELWTFDRIEKLISMAVGYRLSIMTTREDRMDFKKRGTSRTLTLTSTHIEEALRLVRDTNISGVVADDKEHQEDLGGSGDSSGGTTIAEQPHVSTSTVSSSQGPLAAGSASVPIAPISSAPANIVPAVLPPASYPHSAENAMNNLKKLLTRHGHKLSPHEKKLLSTVISPDRIPVGFKDIILPAPTKLMLQTLVTLPLLRPEMFSSGILSRHSISGVLLFGPPGTGKTMLAKAIAKSSGARFMCVTLSDVFDKYVGEGEKKVRAIFSLARKLSPCVVFLDEVDAIFGNRRGGDGVNSSKREIINEFMSEWDGVMSNNQGLIIMGATNRPFDLDDAILRRMPRRVAVELPGETERKKILHVHLKDELLDSDVNLEELAKRTKVYSGSDLKNICISAALARVKESVVKEIWNSQLEASRQESQPSDDTESVLKFADTIEEWSQVLPPAKPTGSSVAETASMPSVKSSGTNLGPLNMAHFNKALKEVPPSLTDEMQTLKELKKWDDMYGDNAWKKKGGKPVWGFEV
ncbi:hypothetical protein HDU76_009143 [Blyttiomyces sp. JEL0837]|nr:hypothetical protein HDU76_009143 [Blyttiomyces sp. JEL0837]